MAGRAQVFSDPEVIRLLSEHFIPVGENCSPLQWQQDAKGEFFRLAAEQGHYAGRTFPTSTRQGYYVLTADGTVLGAHNVREPRQMEALLRTSLRRWELLSAGAEHAALDLPDYTPARPNRYPEGGLVLQLAARDLPRAEDTRPDDWRKAAWNLDYAWFTADEARALVPEARVVGSVAEAPWPVMRRLARFHLRDFVRGETPVWPEEAVSLANLGATVVDVSGPAVRLALTGGAILNWEWRWHDAIHDEDRAMPSGFSATFRGEATWDDERAAFTSFAMVAAGPRFGASQYNNRRDDLGPAPMGVAFVLAGDEPRHRTPPHAINHPDYFAG